MQSGLISNRSYLGRSCPACGTNNAGRSIMSTPPAESEPFETLRKYWYGFFKDKRFFAYDRCKTCGMLYCAQYFSEAQLTDLYASMPANMEEVSPGSLARTQAGYFDQLQRNAALRGQFLEIGPDTGLFAELCLRNGTFQKFWMFEPNAGAHAELRRRLSGADVEISTAHLDLSIVPEGAVTVAAMIHVLDHIVDPVQFLRELRPKMAPAGIILIVTHDESSLLARILRAKWPAYCLQHPHLFNPESIRRLLASGGFEVTSTVKSVNHFPLSFLAKQAALVLGARAEFPALARWEIPLRLGNFITVAKPQLSVSD